MHAIDRWCVRTSDSEADTFAGMYQFWTRKTEPVVARMERADRSGVYRLVCRMRHSAQVSDSRVRPAIAFSSVRSDFAALHPGLQAEEGRVGARENDISSMFSGLSAADQAGNRALSAARFQACGVEESPWNRPDQECVPPIWDSVAPRDFCR
jgi:hypothetical protein